MTSQKRPKLLCNPRRLVMAAAIALLSASTFAQKNAKEKPIAPLTGAQIVSDGGEPELRVGGVPFFIHAAQFDYFRIPADLWFRSLVRYHDLGINTIDLRIPWNWHETSDGKFDFDGHTNPRRNLSGLLRMIAQMHMKLIVRPGPFIGDDWRNAGYPPWLLAYSEYRMSPADVMKGLAPPEEELATRDPSAAARRWLANEIHMTYTRRWLTAVAARLAPYSAKSTVKVTEPGDRDGETQENQIAGPLIFVVLDAAAQIRPGAGASDVNRYLTELRGALIRGGLDAMLFVDSPDASVRGASSFSVDARSGDMARAGIAGQWFFSPSKTPVKDSTFSMADASSLMFLAGSLGTQSDFPPFLSGFAATVPSSGGEARPQQPPPENTLLASRLLLGSGIRAFEYTPLQDTLTPAGWETPSAARHFRWDAALDLAGNHGPRASAVERNGQFVNSWGAMLAASHPRADFGIVDLRVCTASGDEPANSRNAHAVEESFREAASAGFAPELVNPGAQSVGRLLRDRVILLPEPEKNGGMLALPERAREALAEYARRGGKLLDLPSTDHESLTRVLGNAGVVPGSRRTASGATNENLVVTELVSNEIPAATARPQACAEGQLCAAALVSVTNLSPDQADTESFEMADPFSPAHAATAQKISFDVTMPPHESLFLPIHAPLCSATSPGDPCSDEVISAGAELLGAEREGKTLELTFYAPARAEVQLHLESAPSRVELDQDIRLDDQWKQETNELHVSVLRGAAPDYRRVLMIHLRYTPHVAEKPDPAKEQRLKPEFEVFDSLRFPLAVDARIPTSPPLVVANPGTGGSMIIASSNHSDSLRVADFDLEGAFHGTGSARMLGVEQSFTRLHFQPAHDSGSGEASAAPASDGLLHATLAIRSGRDHETIPVLFVPPSDTGNTHYQYDFDRDGVPEWVLESPRLRMIVSPADGGRGLALVDKSTGENLITLGGALHDFVVPADASPKESLAAGDFSFNRAYNAEWIEEKKDTDLKLSFDEYGKSVDGLHVEKTLRLTAPETIETSYRVSDAVFNLSMATGGTKTARSFISMLSVPVPDISEGSTRFCWNSTSTQTQPAAPDAASGGAALPQNAVNPHCEDFVPSGGLITIPEGITGVEIASAGHAALAVEWTSGQMIVIPKVTSANLDLVVPVPASKEPPAEFALRYTIESGH